MVGNGLAKVLKSLYGKRFVNFLWCKLIPVRKVCGWLIEYFCLLFYSISSSHFCVCLSLSLQEVGGVLRTLEETLSEAQRVDTKAQSALDLKKQNLKDETKKRKELVKNMEEVWDDVIFKFLFKLGFCICSLVSTLGLKGVVDPKMEVYSSGSKYLSSFIILSSKKIYWRKLKPDNHWHPR